ncbi:MAG TPA: putative dsRNA-binding protein, partial [Burkholderiaceae bacterium]|nr:putative dsRNA-binding protein [Burkholderiaceae bacterium]
GFDQARRVIAGQYESLLADINPVTLGKDPKTLLQELLQARRRDLPVYTVVSTRGAAHDQLFEVECRIAKPEIAVTASGSSRRAAEQDAAELAIQALNRLEPDAPAGTGKGGSRGARSRRSAQLTLPVAVPQETK